MSRYRVAAFYRFVTIPDPVALQKPLLSALCRLDALGTVLLATEGLNGTIAAAPDKLDAALAEIRVLCGVPALECKYADTDIAPFRRIKVRLKREIVTMGEAVDPARHVGSYVDPEDWNKLITEPGVVLIDTRNAYEHAVGTFKGAIDPCTESFGAFPGFVRDKLRAAKDTKIAMFCTGGIRCEKATSLLKQEGFENVFHLRGGILKYLEDVPEGRSLWQGECFVFDERVAVGHGLRQGTHSMCHGCLMPVSEEARQSPLYEEGVSCPGCAERLTVAQRASNRERQRQFVLASRQGRRHLGPVTARAE